MMQQRLNHEFVKFMPDILKPNVLYISMEYATAKHLCCCGCGEEIVTPFTPTDWRLIFDGETISLAPSIGNWNLPCKSHYWIRGSRVVMAGRWSDERIAAERHRDALAKEAYYGKSQGSHNHPAIILEKKTEGLFRKLVKFICGIK